jgi:NADPH:quinone reductase
MKAAIYTEPGDPSVLHLADVPDPITADNELLIRVEAVSIEYGDLIGRKNMIQSAPDVLGYAAAGEILEVGSAVEGFAVGQKVTTFNFKGSHAELRAVPAAASWIIPDGLDVRAAAAVPCGPGTAAIALQLGGLKHGEIVLIPGAAGGVGLAAVQLAAETGSRVIGTGTSRETLEKLREYGLADAIVLGNKPASEQIRNMLGGPCHGCECEIGPPPTDLQALYQRGDGQTNYHQQDSYQDAVENEVSEDHRSWGHPKPSDCKDGARY